MQTENENLKVTANMGTMGLALGPCSLPGQVVNISLVLVVVVRVMVMLVMVMILFLLVFWMVVKNLVLVVVLVPEVFPDMLSGTKQFSCSSTVPRLLPASKTLVMARAPCSQ